MMDRRIMGKSIVGAEELGGKSYDEWQRNDMIDIIMIGQEKWWMIMKLLII